MKESGAAKRPVSGAVNIALEHLLSAMDKEDVGSVNLWTDQERHPGPPSIVRSLCAVLDYNGNPKAFPESKQALDKLVSSYMDSEPVCEQAIRPVRAAHSSLK